MSDPKSSGLEALKSGDPKAALPLLTEAVKQNPQDAQAHSLLGTAYGQLSMFDRAAECLAQSVRIAPDVAAYRFNYGTALEKLGRRNEAVEAYQRAVALDRNYERASQALARLGVAVAPPAAPAAPPPAAGPGVGDFAFGAALAAPHAHPAGPAPTIPAGQWPTPPPTAAPPPPPSYGPPGYAPPMAAPSGPPQGMQPLGNWSPPPSAAPPSGAPQGMQPLGDWTPAPPPPGGGYGPTPGTTVHAQTVNSRGASVVATAEAEGASMSRSSLMGHSCLIGMGLGIWWGLIGAVVTFLMSLATMTASRMSHQMPTVLTMCVMWLALGTLLYGLIGIFCGSSDDPESLGNTLGIVLGFVTVIFLTPMMMGFILYGGLPTFAGTIWASKMFGKSVGGRVAEFSSSTFIVAGAGGVALTRR